ncbi:MAG: hypothetical protein OES09_09825 [Gammaproteobacteria bacterium]|nr:hypothetical protein [Gammaproteobacteria bacterium]
MKRIRKFLLDGKSPYIFILALLLSLGLDPVGAEKPDCTVDDSHPSCKPDGDNGRDINVQVTIDNFFEDTLLSDGSGPYVDGADNITANISDL